VPVKGESAADDSLESRVFALRLHFGSLLIDNTLQHTKTIHYNP